MNFAVNQNSQNGQSRICQALKLPPVLLLALMTIHSVEGQGFIASRINNGLPVISENMFIESGAASEEGANINGPSIIRIPEWIPSENRADPSAQYYLYFAHHKGNYIRMAWSHDVEGPWNLYKTGSMLHFATICG